MGPRLLARAWVSIHEASGPSPGLPKLASSPRQTVLSQSGEEAPAARAASSLPPLAICECDKLFHGEGPCGAVLARLHRTEFALTLAQPRWARPFRGGDPKAAARPLR